jgi:hypothetical protein
MNDFRGSGRYSDKRGVGLCALKFLCRLAGGRERFPESKMKAGQHYERERAHDVKQVHGSSSMHDIVSRQQGTVED